MTCQSAALTEAAETFTSTSAAAGSGPSTFSSRATSEVPYQSCTSAFMAFLRIARPFVPTDPFYASYGPGRRTILSFPDSLPPFDTPAWCMDSKARPHAVVTRCSSPRHRIAGWRCPRPDRQSRLPPKVGITTPGGRPATPQARRAHWRTVAARDQPRSRARLCGGGLPARRSRLAGSP
jgi:hypothetical protein